MDEQLKNIQKARAGVFMPTGAFGLALVVTFGGGYFFQPIGVLGGLAMMVVVLQRLKKAAHLPCPRCGDRFGAKGDFVLGVGGMTCQNCDLHLHIEQKG
ncbi:MAG: hypothetical protein HUJ31_14580 [Pseudomonadales bacterium]|nr:hypothetical protein [Pseudomonadales bacterium]